MEGVTNTSVLCRGLLLVEGTGAAADAGHHGEEEEGSRDTNHNTDQYRHTEKDNIKNNR